MKIVQINNNTSMWPVFLLLFFITLSRYSFWIGFSLKIYMIFLVILFSYILVIFYFRTLYHYEVLLIFFILPIVLVVLFHSIQMLAFVSF